VTIDSSEIAMIESLIDGERRGAARRTDEVAAPSFDS
jgi:hypothetical protein